jgi:hypothetical protein
MNQCAAQVADRAALLRSGDALKHTTQVGTSLQLPTPDHNTTNCILYIAEALSSPSLNQRINCNVARHTSGASPKLQGLLSTQPVPDCTCGGARTTQVLVCMPAPLQRRRAYDSTSAAAEPEPVTPTAAAGSIMRWWALQLPWLALLVHRQTPG